jgi:putative sugar O-methyltransferase
MFIELKNAPELMQPSKLWDELNQTNIVQLEERGLENLRNTVACNYFTFMGDRKQFSFLKNHLSKMTYLMNKFRAHLAIHSPQLKHAWNEMTLIKEFMFTHTYYTHMLFDYVKSIDTQGLLRSVKESSFGNPPPVYRGKKLITADLANSILEYYSMTPALNDGTIDTIMELGAGYGRNASIFLQKHPNTRYIIVDIPPALYVSQSYLSHRFPDKKVFSFRSFHSFEEVQEEWEQSSICFLLPHQAKLVPKKSIDLFLNISSFQEMRLDQITYYFAEIDRLVRGYFYLKQWQVSHIPQENVTIRQSDYPVFPKWRTIYSRPCAVQTSFFEALYKIA